MDTIRRPIRLVQETTIDDAIEFVGRGIFFAKGLPEESPLLFVGGIPFLVANIFRHTENNRHPLNAIFPGTDEV